MTHDPMGPMWAMYVAGLREYLATGHALLGLTYIAIGALGIEYARRRPHIALYAFMRGAGWFVLICGVCHELKGLAAMFVGGVWHWIEGHAVWIDLLLAQAFLWRVWVHRHLIDELLSLGSQHHDPDSLEGLLAEAMGDRYTGVREVSERALREIQRARGHWGD